MDYSKISTEELREMSEKAFLAYYAEATKPCGNYKKGMRFYNLEQATKRLEEIDAELEKRF